MGKLYNITGPFFFLYTNNHLTEHISYNNLNHKNVYTIYNKRTLKTKYKQLVDYAAFVRPYLKLWEGRNTCKISNTFTANTG